MAAICAGLMVAAQAFAAGTPSHAGSHSRAAADSRAKPPKPLPRGIRVPQYSPGHLPFRPGEQLIYQASWIGIPAASGKVALRHDHKNPVLSTAEIWVKTNRLIDKFYRMRDYLRENFNANSLKPANLFIRQREGHRHDDFNVTFDHGNHVVTLVKHGPRGVQTRKFLSHNPSGPVSAALMALSQPLKVGDSLSFDAFSGTTRYIFDLKVVRREHISTPLGDFDSFRIVPSIAYLSGGKIDNEVSHTVLWVSADSRRLPLRIESAVFIGRVRIDLVRVINAAAPQSSQGSAKDPRPRRPQVSAGVGNRNG